MDHAAPPAPILLTRRQAAEALAISEKYLYLLTKRGLIPCVRLGGSVRYRPSEIEAALDRIQERQQGAESDEAA